MFSTIVVCNMEIKMVHKAKIHKLFGLMSEEVLAFIKESESEFAEGWVPATYIKDQLDLKMSAYPHGNKIDNKTGWLFSTIARYLQDKNLVVFKSNASRSFY